MLSNPRRQRGRTVGDVFPRSPARLVEVDVGVYAAREHMQAVRVDLVGLLGQVRADFGDDPVRDSDIHALNAPPRDHPPAADDHSKSRKRDSTSIATPTSSTFTDSAGLWLIPPLQRTKSIAMSVSSDM